MQTIDLTTNQNEQIIDITNRVNAIVYKSGVKSGTCSIYSPHTTAAIAINENADPNVKTDILLGLNNIVRELNFDHIEGNSRAHIKAILVGKSQTIIVEDGKLALGAWDGIYFCEFDGPRSRKVWVKIK